MSTTLWIKATRSGTNGGNCVEVRRHHATVQLRDSKHHGTGPVLTFDLAEFEAFLAGVRGGEFDHLFETVQALSRTRVRVDETDW